MEVQFRYIKHKKKFIHITIARLGASHRISCSATPASTATGTGRRRGMPSLERACPQDVDALETETHRLGRREKEEVVRVLPLLLFPPCGPDARVRSKKSAESQRSLSPGCPREWRDMYRKDDLGGKDSEAAVEQSPRIPPQLLQDARRQETAMLTDKVSVLPASCNTSMYAFTM